MPENKETPASPQRTEEDRIASFWVDVRQSFNGPQGARIVELAEKHFGPLINAHVALVEAFQALIDRFEGQPHDKEDASTIASSKAALKLARGEK